MKKKFREWARRYLPAEVVSLIATLLSAWLAHRSGGGAVAIALISTWGGNIAYYGYILTADIRRSLNAHRQSNTPYTRKSAAVDIRSLIVEFGLGEVVDSLFIRPGIMYYVPTLVHNFAAGILLAKLTADVCFYVPTIIGYEMNKKYLKKTT
jgi:hypothetical protein